MADSKISNLTATTTFDDADLATTVQSGVNKKITGASLKTVIGWERSGTEVTPKTAGDDINFGTGALKDNDVVVAVALGDSASTSLNFAFAASTDLAKPERNQGRAAIRRVPNS